MEASRQPQFDPGLEQRISVRVVQGGRLKFCWRKPRGFETHLMHSAPVAHLVEHSFSKREVSRSKLDESNSGLVA